MDRAAEVRAWLEPRADEMAALVEELGAVDTENPPGRGLGRCGWVLRDGMARLGVSPELIELAPTGGLEDPCIVRGGVGVGQRTVYFHGHFDVVPAQDPAQFRPQRREGRIVGRGTAEELEVELARLTDTIAEAAARAGAEVTVDVLQRAPSASTAETHPASAALARCIARIEGASPRFELCPGVLETRWYAQLGIPAFAYGAGRLDVSHGPHEFIDEDAMRRCAAVYALFADEVLQWSQRRWRGQRRS